MLLAFIEHRREVVTRRTQYELAQAEARAHILEGFMIAIDNIDAVIKTIRASRNKEEGIPALMKGFELSEKQAVAIWEMQLGKLSGLEIEKVELELKEKKILIADLRDILAKPERVNTIISEELDEINDKFGDDRLTEVHP